MISLSFAAKNFMAPVCPFTGNIDGCISLYNENGTTIFLHGTREEIAALARLISDSVLHAGSPPETMDLAPSEVVEVSAGLAGLLELGLGDRRNPRQYPVLIYKWPSVTRNRGGWPFPSYPPHNPAPLLTVLTCSFHARFIFQNRKPTRLW